MLCKGDQSGNYQHIVKISTDCDGDSLLITVDSAKNPFCHTNNQSCFNIQSVIKSNLTILNEHLLESINKKSYTGIMQANPDMTFLKCLEEFWEIQCSNSEKDLV